MKTHFVIAQAQSAQQPANISLPWFATPLLSAVVGAILALSIQKYMAIYNQRLTLQKEKSNQSKEDRKKVIEMETNSPVLAAIAALDTKLTGEIKSLDQKLTGEITQFRTAMNTNFQTVDKRLANLEKGQNNTNQNLFHLVEILNLDRENHITLYKE